MKKNAELNDSASRMDLKSKAKVGHKDLKPKTQTIGPLSLALPAQRSVLKLEDKNNKSKVQMRQGCRSDNGVRLYNRFSPIDSQEE